MLSIPIRAGGTDFGARSASEPAGEPGGLLIETPRRRSSVALHEVASGKGIRRLLTGLAGVGMLLAFCGCEPEEECPVTDVVFRLEGPGLPLASAERIAIGGRFAVLGLTVAQVSIVDVSDPANPRVLGSHAVTGPIADIAVSGPFAYVADAGSDLHVLDLSAAPSEQMRAGVAGLAGIRALRVVSDRLLLAAIGAELHLLDLRDPAAPRRLNTYPAAVPISDVDQVGTWVCLAGPAGGLEVTDLADPRVPRRLSYTPGQGNPVLAVAAVGNDACVLLERGRLRLISLRDPAVPRTSGTWELLGGSTAVGVRVVDTTALVWDGEGRCSPIDLRGPSRQAASTNFFRAAGIADLEIQGDCAYLASRTNGLRIVGVESLHEAGSTTVVDTPGVARGLALQGSRLFIADGPGGLRILDVVNPLRPVELGTLRVGEDLWGIDVQGAFAYLADAAGAVWIVDVGDPTRPEIRGVFHTEGSAKGVEVSGTLAYAACSNAGLVILDVSSPAQPRWVGHRSMPAARNVTVRGNRAWVADLKGGLWVVDVSRPSAPVTVGRYTEVPAGANWYLRDVGVMDDVALLAVPVGSRFPPESTPGGLRMVRFDGTARPALEYSRGGTAYGVAVVDQQAFVTTDEGLEEWDCTVSRAPRLIRTFHVAGAPWDAAVAGRHAFLAMGKGGVLGLEVAPRARFLHPPILRSGFVSLSWIGSAATRLEWATGLESADWQEVPASRGTGQARLELTPDTGARFFRLVDLPQTPAGTWPARVDRGHHSIPSTPE